jgi:UDP:flavonoid glycosyltransferase YjiC (YdhE family)
LCVRFAPGAPDDMNTTNNPKTYLFFPIEIGLAHICRSLAVAEELHARGHIVHFALPKRKQATFASSPIHFVPIEDHYAQDDFGMNVKMFRKSQYIESMVNAELELIDKYTPDAVVIDFRLSAFAAAAIRKVKTYAIFVGDGLPYGSHLPNPGLPKLLYKMFRNIFPKMYDLASRWYMKPFLKMMKRHECDISYDQWMQNVEYFVPEPSFYMPGISKQLNVHYVSPLGWHKFNIQRPTWLENIHPDGNTIYLSFGGTGFDKRKPIEISRVLLDAGYRVIVSTGNISDPENYPNNPNLYVERYLPGNIVSSKVDLVICHGGYGTSMDAIQHNVPVLAIPFNPDQILHAARMQEFGIAESMYTLQVLDILHIFTFNWKHIEDKGKALDNGLILNQVRYMFDHMLKYKQSLKEFNRKYPSKNGNIEVADIIEKES